MYGNQNLSNEGEVISFERVDHNLVTLTLTLAPQRGLFHEEGYLARFFDNEQNLVKVNHSKVKYFVSS